MALRPLIKVHSLAVLGGGVVPPLPLLLPELPPQPEASSAMVRVKIGSMADDLADRLFKAG